MPRRPASSSQSTAASQPPSSTSSPAEPLFNALPFGPLSTLITAWLPRNGNATGNGARNPDSSPTPSPWTQSLRPTLNWGLQSMMAGMRAAEEWQRAQLEGVHLSLHRHEQVHRQMEACSDLAELAGLQAELMRFDGATAMHLSQRRYDAMLHLQTALMRAWAEWLLGGRGQWTRSLFEAMQSGFHTGFRPLDEIFNAPLQRELFGQQAPNATGSAAASSGRPTAGADDDTRADPRTGRAGSVGQQVLNGVRHRQARGEAG